jgi:hypothetical protein
MNKSQQVAEFIRLNNPKRKEIIKHLVCNINGMMTEEQFDSLEGDAKKSVNAFWSTNFAKWRRVGTIEVVGGKYSLTNLYNGSLYTTKLTPIKPLTDTTALEEKARHWKQRYWDMVAQRNELVELNNKHEEKINELKTLFGW